jgi:type IV secretory pathway VirB10-like protein
MQVRLRDLGFAEVEVIDEDLGRSTAGTVTRSGFERMVAEVSLRRVGAVAAREVFRFARNSRDCQQLVEVCRNIQPTLTIRPGFPVRVMVTHDLVLEPCHQL